METNSITQQRRSGRTPKRKESSVSILQPAKKTYRKCEKAGCPCERPSCFARAASGCVKDGYTSRWYHMSNAEHFCNECFEHYYRSYKEGNKKFADWKLEAAANSQKELSIKLFFAEEVLNYWTICSKCKKWRTISDSKLKDGVIDGKWHCSKVNGWTCNEEESEYVQGAKSTSWLSTLTYTPLLKFSSSFPVLKEYYQDGIGFSALSLQNDKHNGTEEDVETRFIQPFYNPNDNEKAGCYHPDMMLPEEKKGFPHLEKQPSIYLGIRNLLLSLWNSDFKVFLSLERSMPHVVIRGLARVTFCELLRDVLDFLTLQGTINFGMMTEIPRDAFLNKNYFKGSVIVIGAGFAGLSAAIQLQRAGCEVKVLEARSGIGGRVQDDHSLGMCISKGPQIITGCINNPMYIVTQQLDLPSRCLRPRCNLINGKGEVTDEEIDQKVEFYFNLMLESMEEMKQDENSADKMISLKDCLVARKADLEAQIYRELTAEEESLLQFHLANLEYACGASLQDISARHWNQNESMLQFVGDHAWLESGFGTLVATMSRGVEIRCSNEVTKIDYAEERVQITNHVGEKFSADKVIVTVPLSVLKKEAITFEPPLPDAKKISINNIGAGLIEKLHLRHLYLEFRPLPVKAPHMRTHPLVIMSFETNFWKDTIRKADYFGRVPDSADDRGFACLFYDVSNKEKFALMALLAGDAAKEAKKLNDKEVVDRCIRTLEKMFPTQTVPKPTVYFVSHWGSEKHIEMTYSYVGLSGSGEDYDNLAESVDDKLYFAGEATNRRFPQTVTGAFISGLREARKILTSAPEKDQI